MPQFLILVWYTSNEYVIYVTMPQNIYIITKCNYREPTETTSSFAALHGLNTPNRFQVKYAITASEMSNRLKKSKS